MAASSPADPLPLFVADTPWPPAGDQPTAIATLTQAMNDCMERWIREWPEGWLWLHRRFPKEIYRRGGTGFPVHGAG